MQLARVVTTESTNMIRKKVAECFTYSGALSAKIGDNPKVIWIMDDTGKTFEHDQVKVPRRTCAISTHVTIVTRG